MRGRSGAGLLGWLAPALAIAASPVGAQMPGDPDGGLHVGVAVGTMEPREAPVFERNGEGFLLDLHLGWWLSETLRLDATTRFHTTIAADDEAEGDVVADPGPPVGPGPPRIEGADTLTMVQVPVQFEDVGSNPALGLRLVQEVRAREGGLAFRVFAGGSWSWRTRLPMASVGAGLRLGPQRVGLAVEYAYGAVPLPRRVTRWHFEDGVLLRTEHEQVREWANPWSLRVGVDVNP